MVQRSRSECSLWMNRSFRHIHPKTMSLFDTLDDFFEIRRTIMNAARILLSIKNKLDPENIHNIQMCLEILSSERYEQLFKCEDCDLRQAAVKFLAMLTSILSEKLSDKVIKECVDEMVDGRVYKKLLGYISDSKNFIRSPNRVEINVVDNYEDPNVKIEHHLKQKLKMIEIKNCTFLGITIKNSHYNILVERVIAGSIAHKNGLFQTGDEILEVNGRPVKCWSVNEVTRLINNSKDVITLLTCVNKKQSLRKMLLPDNLEPIYIKAMIDFDPIMSQSLECPELGLPFYKGDVMKVVEYTDSSWWQAYMHNDSTQTIAGLIPSQNILIEKQNRQSEERSSNRCALKVCSRNNFKSPQITYEGLAQYEPKNGLNWLFVVVCQTKPEFLKKSFMHSDKFTLVRSPVYCKSEIHQKSVEKVFRSSQMYLNKENWSYSKKSGDFLTFKTKFAPKNSKPFSYSVGIHRQYIQALRSSKPAIMIEKSDILPVIISSRLCPFIIYIMHDTQDEFSMKDTEKNYNRFLPYISHTMACRSFDEAFANTLKAFMTKVLNQPQLLPKRLIDHFETIKKFNDLSM